MKEIDKIDYFGDRWADIGDLINRWAKRFPGAYQENMKWVQTARQEYKMEKHKDRPLRKGLLLHPSLLGYIEDFHPDFMKHNDDVKEFGKRFRQFVIDTGVLPVRK